MLIKHLVTILTFFPLSIQAQNRETTLITKCTENAFAYFNRSIESKISAKHIRLDLQKSSYYNDASKTYIPVSQNTDTFKIDRIDLSFAVVYMNDTLGHLYYEFNTDCQMLRRFPHPVSFSSLIRPYLKLFEGKLAFDYKRLKQKLDTMNLGSSTIKQIELHDGLVIDHSKKVGKFYSTKARYYWIIFTDCPESKCRQLEISAEDGHLLADDLVRTH